MTDTAKWIAEGLSKEQLIAANKAFSSVKRAGRSSIEITGVIGGEESRFTIESPFGAVSPATATEIERLANEYGCRLTPENINVFIADCTATAKSLMEKAPVIDKRISSDEDARRKQEHNDRIAKEREQEEANLAALGPVPAGAAALIVAELHENDCDSLRDHFGRKIIKRVAIGWRFSKREDFRALRAAAESYPPTAHLGTEAAKTIEHRENYSGGMGYYLKHGSRYDTGWAVYSDTCWKPLHGSWEFAIPSRNSTVTAPANIVAGKCTISINLEKAGIEIRFEARPTDDVLNQIRGAGWRWSRYNRCWYTRNSDESLAWATQFATQFN